MTAVLADTNRLLFSVTALSYAAAMLNYIASLVSPRALIQKFAAGLRLAGLAFHTVFLASRYLEAGLVEVGAREAMGEQLRGYEWFWVFISHPPYTNLYESLMFITWTLMVAYAFIEWRWKLQPMGVVAVGITLAGLAEAYIVLQKDVAPLVPALQSWWILIHVGMIFVAYSLFMLAAVVGLLYLLRVGVRTQLMGAVHCAGMAVVALLAGGLGSLLKRAAFEVVPLARHDGKWMAVHWFPTGAEKAQRWFYTVPGVGPLVLASVVVLLVAAALYWREYKANAASTFGLAWRVNVAGFGLLTLALGWLVFQLATTGPFDPPTDLAGRFAANAPGPFRLSVGSNYALGLLATTWASVGLFLGMALRREHITAQLPDPKKLDDMVYKVVIVAFPLISIGIVMGAMWAFDAWGRYWGWDPKETWALITWAIYAIYLHVRLTYGPGKLSAAIAVFAFGVVVFTYMGVNLGLTGEGLHVYGQS
jgi:ABC-type transport system involved in cytochrome c biogenesis permease subunit